MMVGLEVERVRQALALALGQPRGEPRSVARWSRTTAMPNVSDKVVRIIHSYTDYVAAWSGASTTEPECASLVVSQYFWPENFRVNDLVDRTRPRAATK